MILNFFSSQGVCTKGCWTEQVFQYFAPGKKCASSGWCAYSLSKKSLSNHYILHKNNPLLIQCCLLNTGVSPDFWAVKGPSTSSKIKTVLLFISECLVPNWQSCQGVRAPDPPKAHVICLSIFVRLHRSPTLNLQILTFVLIVQEKWHNGNSLCRSVGFCWVWPAAFRHLPPLKEECWTLLTWARATRLGGTKSDFSWQ